MASETVGRFLILFLASLSLILKPLCGRLNTRSFALFDWMPVNLSLCRKQLLYNCTVSTVVYKAAFSSCVHSESPACLWRDTLGTQSSALFNKGILSCVLSAYAQLSPHMSPIRGHGSYSKDKGLPVVYHEVCYVLLQTLPVTVAGLRR